MVRIASVQPVHDYVVRLAFTDGTIHDVDLTPFLWGPVFEPILEDRDLFLQVTVDKELGTIAWPNEADLDPDVLYETAQRQTG